jgi:capsular polysaccharide biosynthesis protein
MGEEYQEIDLIELMFIVLKKWWLILIFALLAGGSSYYYTTNFIEPTYEATATLFIGKEADLLAGFSLSELQVDNKLVVDYRELLRTRLVTEQVIQELGLNIATGSIIQQLSVETISESRFVHLKFKDVDPVVAATIANKLAEVLVEAVVNVIGIENVQIIDAALPPVFPISPSVTMNTATAAVFGMLLALFVVFILHLVDNTIKKEEQLESKLKVPVLGVIPKHKGEK